MAKIDCFASQVTDLDNIILVVEDRWGLGRVLFTALQEERPYRPLFATNGELALEMASRVVPDLIVFHEYLLGLNGWKLANRFRARKALEQVPLLLLSLDDLKEAPTDPHLISLPIPFQLDDFLGLVRSVLATQAIHSVTLVGTSLAGEHPVPRLQKAQRESPLLPFADSI